jgi:2-iminobutanoate/2-iminopropanoate deaminase
MKTAILTQKAPAPIGPYSQAVRFGDLLFISGQIAIFPETGKVIKSDIQVEARLVLENLKAVLTEAGLTMNHILKCSIFLSDMAQFAAVNEVYAEYFEAPFPARETVQVSCLPKNVNIEISAIAHY